jgi:serine protease Do
MPDDVTVKLSDSREFNAKVVGSDQQYDVALLKIDGKNLPTVRVGDSKRSSRAVGRRDRFAVRLRPLGDRRHRQRGRPQHRWHRPALRAVHPDRRGDQPGNSGGPLFNTRGEVVGINSQIFSASGGFMGISFAIPIDLAMSAVEQIKKSGKVTRGQLGAVVEPIDR